MREKVRRTARARIPLRLLLALLAYVTAAPTQAQITQVDFQVIHLSGIRGSNVNYLAVRSQDEWLKIWRAVSMELTLSGEPPTNAAPRPPQPKIDFTRSILLIAASGVKPSSGYANVILSVDSLPASMTGPPPSKNDVTTVHILELRPANCPRLTELTSSVAYALIPQTTNEIRFSISMADSNCAIPVSPPFIK